MRAFHPSLPSFSVTVSASHLVFFVAGHRFAVPVVSVERVVEAVAIRPLPGAPEAVAGGIVVQGAFVPVLDLRPGLKVPRRPLRLEDRFVITRHGALRLALWVDAVGEVGPLPGSDGAPVACDDDGLVAVQDPATLLSPEERLHLQRLLGGGPAGPS